MKQVINIYKKHKLTIDTYLNTLIKSLPEDYIDRADAIFAQHRYIQLIYGVDEAYRQSTPVVCRKRRETENIGSDKSHYFQKMTLSDDMYISNPYIHYRTGRASLSVVYFHEGQYFVFDVDLILLLEELKLIHFNQLHDRFKRAIYFLGSTILVLVAVILLGYGVYVFGLLIFSDTQSHFLHDIFKAIIAVTLGLAIFDLAKQIFEHEVLFQTFEHNDDKQYRVLGRFLISIIIALSIETLLVVFKIALSEDPTQMLSAFYLIVGTTAMFMGLGWFYRTIKQSGCSEEE